MGDVRTDRGVLTTQAYASDANLAARQAIYRYVEPPVNFLEWALEQISWHDVRLVVDVGCGNGAYFFGLRRKTGEAAVILGFDLSEGMIWSARHDRARLTVADVQALPLSDGATDAALAMHMLYHAPDIALAVRELRRVVRGGGTVLAATNGGDHQRELDDAFRRAAGIEGEDPLRVSSGRFTLENGQQILRSAFDDVRRIDLPTTLVVPDADSLVAYVDSTRSWREGLLPEGLSWESCLERVRDRVARHIEGHGAFRITAHAGMFVCR